MIEHYLSDFCPKCGKKNFICLGDFDDISGVDADGIICWNCNVSWLLDATLEIDDPYFTGGQEMLN